MHLALLDGGAEESLMTINGLVTDMKALGAKSLRIWIGGITLPK